MIKAIKLGYTEIVVEICKVNKGVIGKQDVDGRSPLFHAILRGNSKMVLSLVKAGVKERDLLDYKGFNAVFLAIDQGEFTAVGVLLSYPNFQINEETCEKLLLVGCYSNKINLVKSALNHISSHRKIRDEGLSPILISYTLNFVDITFELVN